MSFFKNSQVARLFKVSHTTVTNWIEATEKGQNDLQLATVGKKKVIIDNPHNREIIRKLIERGKKHSWSSKKITTQARQEIYDVFTNKQLGELASSIISKSEIPYKFTYLNGGADLWEKHYQLSLDNKERVVFKENKLIAENAENFLFKFSRFKKINIFDIGCGNGLPSVTIINYLKGFGVELSYTGLDISERMIELDKEVLLSKFPDLDYSSQIIDLDHCNLSELLLTKKEEGDINLLLFLGGTVGNQQDKNRTFSNIRDSMSVNDYLIIGASLETNEIKQSATEPHNQFHYRRTTWILDLLGLEKCYPETTVDRYDSDKKEYTRKILIQKDVLTSLNIGNKTIPIEFKEGSEILVSRFTRFKEADMVQFVLSHNFAIDQFISGNDDSYVLLTLRTKKPL